MLFNSQEFLFVFLPVTLLGFYLIGRVSRQSATLWLILTSLIFYGWWRPLNILIIGPSIIVNYLLASFLLRLSQRGDQPGLSRAVLLARHSVQRRLPRLFQICRFRLWRDQRRVRRQLHSASHHFAARHLVHHLPEDRLPDRRPGRAGEGLHVSRILHLRSLLSPAHRRADRALPRDDAAVRDSDLPVRQGELRGRPHAPVLRPVQEGGSRRQHRAAGDADLRSIPPPPATRLSCWRGWPRSGSRFRSISTSPAIPTWRSGLADSSASSCRRTSIRRSRPRASSISGSTGT